MPINFNSNNIDNIVFGSNQIGEVRLGQTLVWPTPSNEGQPQRVHGWANEFTATNSSRAATGLWASSYQREITGDPASYCFDTNTGNPGNIQGPPYGSSLNITDNVDGINIDMPGYSFDNKWLVQQIYTGDANQEDSLEQDYLLDAGTYDSYFTLAVNTIEHPNSLVQPVTFQADSVTSTLGTFWGYTVKHIFSDSVNAQIGTFFFDLFNEVGANELCYYYLTMGNADGINAFNGFATVQDPILYGDTFEINLTNATNYLYNGLNIDLTNTAHYISEGTSGNVLLFSVVLSRTAADPSIEFNFSTTYTAFQDDFFNFRITLGTNELILNASDFTTSAGATWRCTDSRIWTVLLESNSNTAATPLKIEYTPNSI